MQEDARKNEGERINSGDGRGVPRRPLYCVGTTGSACRYSSYQREENADLTQDDDANSSSVAGALLEWSLKLIGRGNQQKLEGDFLPKKVQDKLQTEMMNMMAEKFEEKRLEADVEIIKEEKQARFFYSKLREVRAVMEEQKGTNPLKELRKKMKKDENDDDDDSDDSF